ncbi:hypothetical protein C0J52_16991 [Blattella germanica]|nr:hypothetical protein C0J52_16991 [Blattella germanica]
MMAGYARQTRGSDVLLEVPLVDGHNDLPYNIRVYAKDQLKNFDFNKNLSTDPYWSTIKSSYTDLPRLRKGRVGGQFWVAYVDCQAQYKDALKQTIEQIDLIHRLIKAYPDDLQYVTTSQGIWDAFNNGKIASMIVVEGGHSIDSQMGILRVMYSLGVRYMTLTHWCNTPWGDASPVDDPTTGVPVVHGGLSEFGKPILIIFDKSLEWTMSELGEITMGCQ